MIVVQARMGSTRLPGKVLRPVAGTTILDLMLDRLARGPVGPVVVATSDLAGDDPIADHVAGRGIEQVFRGAEADVLGRVCLAAAGRSGPVVRLTADCPLMDPTIVAAVVETHNRSGADYTSNTLLRTYPDGLDVEVMDADALALADAEAVDPIEREHVTPFILRQPERFRLAAHVGPVDAEDERWTIDDPDDLAWLESTLTAAPDLVTSGWRDILDRIGIQRPPRAGALVLRVDRDGTGSRPRDAVVLGDPRAELPPMDPGRRTWNVHRDDDLVGRLSVDVTGGRGTLAGWLDPGINLDEAIEALRQRLRADLQVDQLSGLGDGRSHTDRTPTHSGANR